MKTNTWVHVADAAVMGLLAAAQADDQQGNCDALGSGGAEEGCEHGLSPLLGVESKKTLQSALFDYPQTVGKLVNLNFYVSDAQNAGMRGVEDFRIYSRVFDWFKFDGVECGLNAHLRTSLFFVVLRICNPLRNVGGGLEVWPNVEMVHLGHRLCLVFRELVYQLFDGQPGISNGQRLEHFQGRFLPPPLSCDLVEVARGRFDCLGQSIAL
jgi:hypothetical protein